ncbi:hypothetical protein C2I18_11465 [Paenibacillus sp. PK3_47]|nr:hypothetical protein C2I18_11465 [Paenibacillus sp. PK3_47]
MITDITGAASEELLQATFWAGEGFLGQSVLRSTSSQWLEASRDPRSIYFLNRGVPELEAVYCFPVASGGRNVGLLFGISCSGNSQEMKIRPRAEFEKYYLSQYVAAAGKHLDYARQERQLNMYRPLVELTAAAQASEGIPGLLSRIVDTSLSTIDDLQSSLIVYRSANSGQYHTAARGVEQAEGNSRVEEIVQRYFSAEVSGQWSGPDGDKSGYRVSVDKGKKFMEVPIRYGSNTHAVLLAEVAGEGQKSPDLGMLKMLEAVSGLALQTAYDLEQKQDMRNEIAQFLSAVMILKRPESDELLHKARSLIMEYANWRKMDEEEAGLLIRSCLLSCIDHQFIGLLPDIFDKEIGIIEEYQLLKDALKAGEPARCSLEAQTIALAFNYSRTDHTNPYADLSRYDHELSKQFRRFMLQREVVQHSIMVKAPQAVPALQENRELVFERVVEDRKFTQREKDILKLMLEAMNNKEIAKALFISEHTVKNHVTNIFSKLGVSDRSNAIAFVYNHKI